MGVKDTFFAAIDETGRGVFRQLDVELNMICVLFPCDCYLTCGDAEAATGPGQILWNLGCNAQLGKTGRAVSLADAQNRREQLPYAGAEHGVVFGIAPTPVFPDGSCAVTLHIEVTASFFAFQKV